MRDTFIAIKHENSMAAKLNVIVNIIMIWSMDNRKHLPEEQSLTTGLKRHNLEKSFTAATGAPDEKFFINNNSLVITGRNDLVMIKIVLSSLKIGYGWF